MARKPQSRVEEILQAKANGEIYSKHPQSALEELLLNMSSGGGESSMDADQNVQISAMNTKINNLTNSVNQIESYAAEIASDVLNLEVHAITDSEFN